MAVVGSLIACESARMATSTRIRNANIGSCSNVRSSLTTIAPVSPAVAPDPQTRIRSDPVSTLSPTAGISSTTRFSRDAIATSGPSSTPAITPG